MQDRELLNTIEDFIVNNYREPLTQREKAEMFEHVVGLMDKNLSATPPPKLLRIKTTTAEEKFAVMRSLTDKCKWFQYEPWSGDEALFTVKDEAGVLTPGEAVKEQFADRELIKRARKEYGTDEIEIDDLQVRTSRADDGVWVAAWVWLANQA